MQIEHYEYADVALAQAIVRLFDRLKGREEEELHSLLSRGLQQFGCQGEINEKCARWIHRQLALYAADPLNSPRSRIRARLLQQRLCAYLPDLENASDEAFSVPSVAAPAQPTAASPPPNADPDAGGNGKSHQPFEPSQAAGRTGAAKPPNGARISIAGLAGFDASVEDDMARDREALVQRLAETNDQLVKLQQENQQLREDFARLSAKAKRRKRLPPPPRAAGKGTRRMAAIPKRDAFLRQLGAEIERVRRHGAPLALALIDIDDLSVVDREHGRSAVDAVVQCYIGEIFANFRTYDVVARYEHDEFALLFPHTARDGALRALEKAQKRAAETHYALEGHTFPLPGFTGALTHYIAGEAPTSLLERAVEGLVEARAGAGERVVVM